MKIFQTSDFTLLHRKSSEGNPRIYGLSDASIRSE